MCYYIIPYVILFRSIRCDSNFESYRAKLVSLSENGGRVLQTQRARFQIAFGTNTPSVSSVMTPLAAQCSS